MLEFCTQANLYGFDFMQISRLWFYYGKIKRQKYKSNFQKMDLNFRSLNNELYKKLMDLLD